MLVLLNEIRKLFVVRRLSQGIGLFHLFWLQNDLIGDAFDASTVNSERRMVRAAISMIGG
jgi:hypothetical protein